MFWLDVDLATQTTTLHRGKCIHIEPLATDRKGINEMRIDGGWFSFDTIGEAMRFYKVNKLSGEVASCLLCKPLESFDEVSMAKLDVRAPRTGCEIYLKEIEVLDTKSKYSQLLSRLINRKQDRTH